MGELQGAEQRAVCAGSGVSVAELDLAWICSSTGCGDGGGEGVPAVTVEIMLSAE